MTSLRLVGDVNLMNVVDSSAPFSLVNDRLAVADVRFANLECSFYRPPTGRGVLHEGFPADPAAVAALAAGGFEAVGTANNVTYGSEAILSSLAVLDEAGIGHTGSGADSEAAHAATSVIARDGRRVGFLQRTCVYWPTNHEALSDAPGVAAVRCATAYRVPMHKTRPEIPPLNRPGVPPEVVTWVEPSYLDRFRADVETLVRENDVAVVSVHWGLKRDVLAYMRELAHAAIDAGAHVVVGHGPHAALAVEFHRARPILYGLGSFSFHTGHYAAAHDDWVGMLAEIDVDAVGDDIRAAFWLVRRDDGNRTYVTDPAAESQEFAEIERRCAKVGTRLIASGARIVAVAS